MTVVTSYIDYLETLSKKQLMVMLARQRQEETQGIAVIGLGCRFPGGIDGPESFWHALRKGRVVPMATNGSPTDAQGHPRWNLDAPDLAPMADLLRSGAYLDAVDVFDAEYFGVSEEEATQMDPQQRLVLDVALEALADANLPRAALRGRRLGIFIGASSVEYPLAAFRNKLPIEKISPFMATGIAASAISGRLGLTLSVNGPAMTIDTASSSALTALHLASLSLRRRECDAALVGACHLLLSPYSTAILAKAGMLSPSGRSRPFAGDADGHVRAEGCGILVLKRQQDAIADGDLVYALVRGSAVHQHGDRLGLSVAPAVAQKAVIELALRAAGIDPLDVHYVEAQANGSRLGGVIEAEAVAAAYGRRSATAPPLYLGSCKANLGYLETASGAPGLIKAVLAVAHGEIPPHVGADSIDPAVSQNGAALRFAKEPVPWPSAGRRLAGVSALGFTGANAHVVLESASNGDEKMSASSRAPALLVLSAHNPAALAATARRLLRHLEERSDWTHAAVCRTMANGRDHLKFRRAAVVQDRDTVLDALARFAEGDAVAAARERNGFFLVLPDLSPEQVTHVLSVIRQPGFEPLEQRIRGRAEKLGLPSLGGVVTDADRSCEGTALAWSLGWLDFLASIGMEIVGASLGTSHWRSLVAVITGQNDGDRICAAWRAGAIDALAAAAPATNWEIVTNGGPPTLQRAGASAPAFLHLAGLDARNWLERVAETFIRGADLTLSALWMQPRQGMCRLPGPVLTGKSYWAPSHIWS